MSKVDELKNKFPMFNITLLDLFKRLDKSKTKKYVHLYCVVIKDKLQQRLNNNDNIEEIYDYFNKIGVDYVGLDDLTIQMFNHFYNMFNINDYEAVSDFVDFMERDLIPNKDILTYKTTESIVGAVTMASIRNMEKELELQVIKEYEDDKWLILRPLSFNSSQKYGAGTRWCTTYKNEKEYFAKYFTNGALVYFINKLTGYKFAFYKELRRGAEEISFWNAEDTRVDFLNLDIDDYLFPIMKAFAKTEKTNSDFCTGEQLEQVYLECRYFVKEDTRLERVHLDILPVPENYPLPEPSGEITIDYHGTNTITIPYDADITNYTTTISSGDGITLTSTSAPIYYINTYGQEVNPGE